MIIVVGAGLTGAAAARSLADAGYDVTVWERSSEIGGAVRDYRDDSGLLIHVHGPHIYHTNSEEVHAFLGRFGEWTPYRHTVRALVDDRLVPVPFNFESIEQCFSPTVADRYKAALVDAFGEDSEVGVDQLLASSVPPLGELGRFVFEKIFLSYTRKQWGMSPERLGSATLRRVPVRASRRDGYFSDRFQGMPALGYSEMIRRMLDHPRIAVRLDFPAETLRAAGGHIRLSGKRIDGPLIYTGSPDELFDCRHGRLPYRTVRFELSAAPWPSQPVAVVNHPAAPDFTRITEYGHFYPRDWRRSVVAHEYPQAWDEAGPYPPYYPLPTPEAALIHARYREAAAAIPALIPAGRLGSYRYLNMDAAVLEGLQAAEKVLRELS